jgi:hypothetical protein
MKLELDTLWSRRRKIADKRLSICKTCEHYEEDTSRCLECGCYMPAKALWPYSNCPIEKWKSEENENG